MRACRRCPEALWLALLACGCTAAPIETDAGHDAGEDAGHDANTPIAECGNGFLEAGESCDDDGQEDGDGCDADCRFEARCGDGVAGDGEACDDGNTRWNDGCDGRCASDEQCGNGALDLARGEACDDGNAIAGDGCSPECRREGCGSADPTIGAGEACDDGNDVHFDACGTDCRPRVTFSADVFAIAGPEAGCDFTGDAIADNALAVWLRAARGVFNGILAPAVGVSMIILVDLLGLDDPYGESDDDVRAVFAEGWDGDDDGGNNLVRGATLASLERDYPDPPRWVLAGSISGSQLDLAHGSAFARFRVRPADGCALDEHAFAWPMMRARLTGTVGQDSGEIADLTDARLCGAVPVSSMAVLPNPFEELIVLTGCDGSSPTLADLLLGGATGLGFTLPAVEPDADLDGDGLERFELVRGGGCQPVVTACIDGDGTRHEGRECAALPQFADGFSIAIDMTAVAVRMIGRRTDAQVCTSQP